MSGRIKIRYSTIYIVAISFIFLDHVIVIVLFYLFIRSIILTIYHLFYFFFF